MKPIDKQTKPPFLIRRLEVLETIEQNSVADTEQLTVVTSKPKVTIESAEQIPQGKVTWSPITSVMQRPKSTDPNHLNYAWHPQLTKAYLVHAPNGFVGDNVIFDHDNYYSFNKWWLGSSWQVYKNTERVQVESDWVISIAAWGGEAFQHFIIDVFPKLASVIELLESEEYQHIKIASHSKSCLFAQWLWKKLQLEDRVIQKPLNAAEKFVISTPMALYPGFYPSHISFGFYPRDCLLPLQKRLGVLDEGEQDLVIYLPRTGQRRVENQAELLIKLSRRIESTPYRLHVFNASGDFDKDLSIMRRAKIVLGPHGGAFANLAFAKPGTHVIEFSPIYEYVNDIPSAGRNYWGMAQAAGLDYWTLKPDEFSFAGPMTVDFNELNKILDHVIL